MSGTNEIINIPSKRKTQASTKTPILSDGQLYISPTETQSTCLMYWKTKVLDVEHCSGIKSVLVEKGKQKHQKKKKKRTPIFTMCCLRGKIKIRVLKEPPAYLHGLLTNNDAFSRHFRENIRAINMMFSFTSLGGKIDNSINRDRNGPKIFKLHGENYHLIGSLKPSPNKAAKFSQLYIHDTENEVQNRISALR